MAYLDRGGVRIYYESTGSGPAVLLTHGFAASARMFASNVDALAKDHTVVTWDLRGHGRSDYPDDQSAYSAALTIEDMAALLETVGADRGVLMGHSLGGYLSLEFHVRFAERVAGLVLLRQRPGTAKGITFATIEDETGLANLVIRPQIWERFYRVARGSPAWIAHGCLENKEGVIHLVVNRLEDLSHLLGELKTKSRDFH